MKMQGRNKKLFLGLLRASRAIKNLHFFLSNRRSSLFFKFIAMKLFTNQITDLIIYESNSFSILIVKVRMRDKGYTVKMPFIWLYRWPKNTILETRPLPQGTIHILRNHF